MIQRIGIVLLSLGVVATSASAETAPDAPEATVDAFHAALASGAREQVLALLAPDVLIFESGSAELSRDEYASHHLGADMEFSAATTRTVLDRQIGADGEAAWVLTRTTTAGTVRGRELDLAGTETILLRRGSDGWRIVHIHWSSRSR